MTSYHCPHRGSVHPRGKYGPLATPAPKHRGVDQVVKANDVVYATFCGRVRISQYNRGGVQPAIIRHGAVTG